MSKAKKLLLNIFLGFVVFALFVCILFFAIEPGIPTTELNDQGVATQYLDLPNGRYSGDTNVIGTLTGKGTFEFDTGEVYTGSWSDSKMNGKGVLTSTLGNYDGGFENSQRSGKGTFTWTDGTVYEGEWSMDKMCGKGAVTTPGGVVYSGTFDNNMLVNGTVSLENDVAKYTVDVKNGATPDTIKVEYENGVTYEGEYQGTKISGNGTMTFPKKGKYEGAFLDGKRNGQGTFTWEDGTSYQGEWSDDLMNGTGTYTLKNGTYLKGDFEAGKLNGTYTYYNENGSFTTVWENGKCVDVRKY